MVTPGLITVELQVRVSKNGLDMSTLWYSY